METSETTPTYRAVVEDNIVAMHVAMENMLFEMLNECSLHGCV